MYGFQSARSAIHLIRESAARLNCYTALIRTDKEVSRSAHQRGELRGERLARCHARCTPGLMLNNVLSQVAPRVRWVYGALRGNKSIFIAQSFALIEKRCRTKPHAQLRPYGFSESWHRRRLLPSEERAVVYSFPLQAGPVASAYSEHAMIWPWSSPSTSSGILLLI